MLKSEVTFVLCIHAGVSELLAHNKWGGGALCVRTAAGAIAVCSYVSLQLVSAKLGRVETGSKHQEGVFHVKFGIIVAVTEGIFVSNREFD